MRNRLWSLTFIMLLVLLSLLLAGCERDRPVPTAVPTGAASPAPRGTVSPTPPPPPAQTKVVLPTAGSPTPVAPAPAAQPTAVPPARLTPASPTPPPPKPPAVLTPTPRGSQAGSQAYFVYQVKVGDTLGEIAEKFNTTLQAILALNPATDPDVLMAGQELKIPGEAPPEYGGLRTYTVLRGDTLSAIAVRFAVSLAELQQVNNISDPDAIYPGQQLRIPGAAAAPTGQPKTYTVRAGDTLYSIATRFGVTVWALQVANNLANPDQIYVGQELKIP